MYCISLLWGLMRHFLQWSASNQKWLLHKKQLPSGVQVQQLGRREEEAFPLKITTLKQVFVPPPTQLQVANGCFRYKQSLQKAEFFGRKINQGERIDLRFTAGRSTLDQCMPPYDQNLLPQLPRGMHACIHTNPSHRGWPGKCMSVRLPRHL